VHARCFQSRQRVDTCHAERAPPPPRIAAYMRLQPCTDPSRGTYACIPGVATACRPRLSTFAGAPMPYALCPPAPCPMSHACFMCHVSLAPRPHTQPHAPLRRALCPMPRGPCFMCHASLCHASLCHASLCHDSCAMLHVPHAPRPALVHSPEEHLPAVAQQLKQDLVESILARTLQRSTNLAANTALVHIFRNMDARGRGEVRRLRLCALSPTTTTTTTITATTHPPCPVPTRMGRLPRAAPA
jgi:hypothetical protein